MPSPVRKAACHPNWSGKVSNDEAYRRAGGRRHRIRIRQVQMMNRQLEVLKLAMQYGYYPGKPGVCERIGQELGWDRTTIANDLRRLLSGETLQKIEQRKNKKKAKV